jgi:hypothetical protein
MPAAVAALVHASAMVAELSALWWKETSFSRRRVADMADAEPGLRIERAALTQRARSAKSSFQTLERALASRVAWVAKARLSLSRASVWEHGGKSAVTSLSRMATCQCRSWAVVSGAEALRLHSWAAAR